MRFIKIKITSMMYNLLGYFLSYFYVRNNKLWLFGSRDGSAYSDNSKYLFEAVVDKHEINSHWVTKNKNLYHALKGKISIEYFYSLKCQILIARAGVYITSHGINDISPYVRRNRLHVCLWHGLPLKKIGSNTGASRGKNSFLYNLLSLFIFSKKGPDLFLSPSDFYRDIFKEAFSYNDEQFILAQYPRVSKLFEAKNIAKDNKTTLLYAPTFRDDVDVSYYYQNTIIPHGDILDLINKKLGEANAILLLKPHPYISLEKIENDLHKYKNIKYINASEDIFDYLVSADVLITDYSSVFFDYIILGRKIVFFAPDLEWYTRSENRGMYFDYEKFVPGKICRNWESVINESLGENIKNSSKVKEMLLMTSQFPERNEEYIIQIIKDKLGCQN